MIELVLTGGKEEEEDDEPPMHGDGQYRALILVKTLCFYGQREAFSARCKRHILRLVQYLQNGRTRASAGPRFTEIAEKVCGYLEGDPVEM
jgi:hypothetical protein